MAQVGWGSVTEAMGEEEVRRVVAQGFDGAALAGKRVLVIIPDSTRTAPIPLFFRVLYEQLGGEVARLDYLIALGTHPPMNEAAITRLVGVDAQERTAQFPKSTVYNHHWEDPAALTSVGAISAADASELTQGMFTQEVPVVLNRMILDYDQLVILGPVFPHEVAGFSGGAKYLFPGIAGAEIINFTHWLGALVTSMETIGVADTPVRRVIHKGAKLVQKPLICIALVMQGKTLHGTYIGDYEDAWRAATELSGALNVITVAKPYTRVLSMAQPMYDDLWTAAKAMYKTEPAIADGGEVIIYAPHITEISYTHGALIDRVGYHVRDYFVKQWDRFKEIPGGTLAHSTHVKGKGTYDADTGIETPRIQVTLATQIPEERCRRVNLGYVDYRTIDPEEWANREDVGILLVRHAGEMLYRCPALFAQP